MSTGKHGGARPGAGRPKLAVLEIRGKSVKVSQDVVEYLKERPAVPAADVGQSARNENFLLFPQMGLTVKKFQAILDVCQEKGVTRLKVGDLEFRLRKAMPASGTRPVEGATKAGDPTMRLAQEEILRDAESTQQLLDDPLAYEQNMIDGHLTRDQDASQTARHSETQFPV